MQSIKSYEINHRQLSLPGREYWEPGKRDEDADKRDALVYREYHIPSPNPVIETLARQGVGAIRTSYNTGTGVITNESIPAPVITKTTVVTVEETGVQGTHTLNETELVNVNDVAKSAGGWGFEEESV